MLKKKTEEMVAKTKVMVNETYAGLISSGTIDLFDLDASEQNLTMMKSLAQLIELTNEYCELATAYAETIDEMNVTLKKINEKLNK